MIIGLNQFGTMLTTRHNGREAYFAMQAIWDNIGVDEKIEVNFDGVGTLGPSWGDEFLTPLYNKFGDRLVLSHLDNPSVRVTLDTIEIANKIKLNRKTN